MSLAANALTTVAAVQEEGNIAGNESRITRGINAVSQRFEKHCARKFGFASFGTGAPESYEGTGTLRLFLRRRPIVSVVQVKLDGSEVTDYVRSANDDQRGALYREAGWPFWADRWGDLTGDPDLTPGRRRENITVAYSGGFVLPKDATGENPATLPADLELACIREVIRVLYGPAPWLTSEKTAGGWQGTFTAPQALLDETVETLRPYVLPRKFFA